MKEDILVEQAKKQVARINSEIILVGNSIQKLKLDRNIISAQYQSRQAELNKGFLGRAWDFLTLKRGPLKKEVEKSHQQLHELDKELQRHSDKLHQLHFELSAWTQKANKEMFEEVVNAGNETIVDIDTLHKRIDDVIHSYESRFENVDRSIGGVYESIRMSLLNVNEQLNNFKEQVVNGNQYNDFIEEEFFSKIQSLENTTESLDKKIEETKLYTNEQINSQVEKLSQVKKSIEAQKLDLENAITENKQHLKNTESDFKNMEQSFQSKAKEFDGVINKHSEKLSLQNKKIEEYNNDAHLKIDKTHSLLNKTNNELTAFKNILEGSIDTINNQLSDIDQKLNAQLVQNRKFDELIKEQKERSIKLKKAIVLGTILGALGLIGSIAAFIL
jgi:chromosome segregation ATPase